MLKIVTKFSELDLPQLAAVYTESNREAGIAQCPMQDANAQILYGEQLFYDYLMYFLEDPRACLAIWIENGKYVSALRMDPYMDGLLLNGLETHPDYRRMGYAEKLLQDVLRHFSSNKIYSHVEKSNQASLSLHCKCGFEIIANFAKYLDGSTRNSSYTLLYEQK